MFGPLNLIIILIAIILANISYYIFILVNEILFLNYNTILDNWHIFVVDLRRVNTVSNSLRTTYNLKWNLNPFNILKVIINSWLLYIYETIFHKYFIYVPISSLIIFREYTKSTFMLFICWVQVTGIAILTIWARGIGPRVRPDQLSDLVWKDLIIILIGLLLLSMIMMTIL